MIRGVRLSKVDRLNIENLVEIVNKIQEFWNQIKKDFGLDENYFLVYNDLIDGNRITFTGEY